MSPKRSPSGHQPPSAAGGAPAASMLQKRSLSVAEPMIIVYSHPAEGDFTKLTPEIVDAIGQIEAQGGAVRIDFESDPKVVNICGKIYRSVLAESVDLSENFGEHQSGEDGSTWYRAILSDTANNQVNIEVAAGFDGSDIDSRSSSCTASGSSTDSGSSDSPSDGSSSREVDVEVDITTLDEGGDHRSAAEKLRCQISNRTVAVNSKRALDSDYSVEKPGSAKRCKSACSVQALAYENGVDVLENGVDVLEDKHVVNDDTSEKCQVQIVRENTAEDKSIYSKYIKKKPELKGPIKDFSQFGQYVSEYQGKYGLYCSLSKDLENTRNVFLRLGNDLEKAKERDTKEYFNVQKELKEMYIRHGMRHKQMKVIFTVLHEELKNLKEMIRDFALCYEKA